MASSDTVPERGEIVSDFAAHNRPSKIRRYSEFAASDSNRCSVVLKDKVDAPSQRQIFLALLERCEGLVEFYRFDTPTVMSMDRLRRMVSEDWEGVLLSDNLVCARFDAVVSAFTGKEI